MLDHVAAKDIGAPGIFEKGRRLISATSMSVLFMPGRGVFIRPFEIVLEQFAEALGPRHHG